eukprot:1143560-Pelagomonas_calceolata.AAC.5
MQSIRTMQDSVVQLDIVAARAQHAKWMGATRPRFTTTPQSLTTGHGSDPAGCHEANGSSQNGNAGGHASSLIWVPGALHPLLLSGSLPPTPNPPSVCALQLLFSFSRSSEAEERVLLASYA